MMEDWKVDKTEACMQKLNCTVSYHAPNVGYVNGTLKSASHLIFTII